MVSTEEYGKGRALGIRSRYFKLEEMLRKMPLDDVAKADLESVNGSGAEEWQT